MSGRNPWYVLTGGPCAGKTTLIRELESDGVRIVHESARVIIEKGMEGGKTLDEIRADPAQFTRDIIALDTANLSLHPSDERVFFDRSILDNIGYHNHLGLTPAPELIAACETARFSKVFILELVNYTQDYARNESPEEALAIQDALEAAYRAYDIPVVKVPVMPVEERVAFVLANL